MLTTRLFLLFFVGVCHSFVSTRIRTRPNEGAVLSQPMKTGFILPVVTVSRDYGHSEVTNYVQEKDDEDILGFELPVLTYGEKKLLLAGERIQKQERNGASGQGLVVLDVEAEPDEIFKELLKFEKYGEMIPTVRKSSVLSIRGNVYEVCVYFVLHRKLLILLFMSGIFLCSTLLTKPTHLCRLNFL